MATILVRVGLKDDLQGYFINVRIAVLLPLLALDLHLSVMTRSKGGFQEFLANELLSGLLSVSVDFLELVEGVLEASFGRNLPVADSDFVVAKVVVFGTADVVAGQNISSQRAYSEKQNDPFLIDGYSVAFVVGIPNVNASFRRTEFDGPDVEIECLQVIF